MVIFKVIKSENVYASKYSILLLLSSTLRSDLWFFSQVHIRVLMTEVNINIVHFIIKLNLP